MSRRDPIIVLNEILTCIEHVRTYTVALSFEEFSSNFMVTEACLYNIHIIGEAVNHLPEELKARNPDIPWSLVKGMRNRLIHEYFGTDLPIVWNVIKEYLPTFKHQLEQVIEKLQSSKS